MFESRAALLLTLMEITMSKVIVPTVGRVVHYYPPRGAAYFADAPLCAFVASVIHERCVNLFIVTPNGNYVANPPTGIRMLQPVDIEEMDGSELQEGGYCRWMDYQVGQAAKTEELQEQLNEAADQAETPNPPAAEAATDVKADDGESVDAPADKSKTKKPAKPSKPKPEPAK